MKDFKKFCFLILIICMMFMMGSVSAVNVEDNFTSENSIDDLSAVPDESGDIVESDVLSSDAVEPTGASDTFDDKLSDDEDETRIEFTFEPYYMVPGFYHQNPEVWGYRENVGWSLVIDVEGPPAKDVNFKFDMDGLKSITPKIDDGYDTFYLVNYTFDPDTGIVHFDELKESRYTYSMVFDLVTEITKIGNVNMTVELDYGNSKKNISYTLPTKIGEVDLDLIKSTYPFGYPSWVIVWSPNPDLLGSMDITPYTDDWDDYYYPPRICQLGDEVVWYIRVTNNGIYTAFDVNITDVLPDGLIYNGHQVRTGSFGKYELDYDFSDSATYDEENNVLHVPQILRTQFVDLILFTTVNGTGNITNVGTVTSDNIELNPDDNTGNDTVIVYGTDLVITKSAWTDYEAMKDNANPDGDYNSSAVPVVKIGDTVYWLVVVYNIDRITAENVIVKDVLPEGLEFVKAETEFGSYDIDTNTWTIGSVGFINSYDGISPWLNNWVDDLLNGKLNQELYDFINDVYPYWFDMTKDELLSDSDFNYLIQRLHGEIYFYVCLRDYPKMVELPEDIMEEFEELILDAEFFGYDNLKAEDVNLEAIASRVYKWIDDFINGDVNQEDYPDWSGMIRDQLLSDWEFIDFISDLYESIYDYFFDGYDYSGMVDYFGFDDIKLSSITANFPYLFIETKALDAGKFTNLVDVSTTTYEEDLTNNEANASVIVEQDLANLTAVPEQDNATDNETTPDNSTSDVPVDDDSENVSISSDNNVNLDTEDIQEDSVSESVQPSAVKSATGNPVLLALMALFVATGNIFRRKK